MSRWPPAHAACRAVRPLLSSTAQIWAAVCCPSSPLPFQAWVIRETEVAYPASAARCRGVLFVSSPCKIVSPALGSRMASASSCPVRAAQCRIVVPLAVPAWLARDG
eukprot:scaffold40052_cov18-Prasinocladus_malaysianus.AAC.3